MDASRFALGIDVGLPGMFSALTLVELETPADESPSRAIVRHLERFPPGTNYDVMAAAMRKLLDWHFPTQVDPYPFRRLLVAIDVTAVGVKALDSFRIGEPPPNVTGVILSAGLASTFDDAGVWRVPKTNMVTTLQQYLQGHRLLIPTTLPEAKLLATELKVYQPKVSLNTDPTMANWRDGKADDLIFAVGLGIWGAERPTFGEDDWPSFGPMRGMRTGLGLQADLKLGDIARDRANRARRDLGFSGDTDVYIPR